MQATDQELKRTPLYNQQVEAGGKMVPFGGWAMAVHYGSQLDEHKAVREDVGLFDVSHMGQVFVTGPNAMQLINRMVTRDVSVLKDGEQAYSGLCREDGGLVDDLFIARIQADRWLLVVNAATYDGDVAHMQAIAAKAGIDGAELKPQTEDWAMAAVQGPKWREVCQKVFGDGPWRQLKPIQILSMDFGGKELLFSTTGYTGEPGAELLCHHSVGAQLWDKLVAAGAKPAGLAARDTLRLESGYNLSGQDFTTANNPLEARMGWVTQLDAGPFEGSEALKRIKQDGVKRKLVGLIPEGRRIPRHEAKILRDGKVVGEITSGGFSPTLGHPIAMGYVTPESAKVGTAVEVELGNAQTPAKVSKLPFYATKHQ